MTDTPSLTTLSEDSVARFWSQVRKTETCWFWTGYCRNGYGSLWHGSRYYSVHRVAWTLANGTIPTGLFVCHRCDQKLCVRPDHLFIGTALDNNRDRQRKHRSADVRGERHPRRKLTNTEVLQIRQLGSPGRLNGLNHYALARQFGVSRSLIGLILNKQNWTHV